jgi:hypothetical protein
MKDIADLRINEMEDLLEGMNENAEEQKKMLNGAKSGEVLEGDAPSVCVCHSPLSFTCYYFTQTTTTHVRLQS